MPVVKSSTTHSLQEMCRHFTRATGWPLIFVEVENSGVDYTEGLLRDDPNCCWYESIQLDEVNRGFLTIGLPPDCSQDSTFNSACDLADQLAGMFNQFTSTSRSLHRRTDDLSAVIDVGNMAPSEDNMMELLQRLLSSLLQLTSFQSTAFFLLDPSASQVNLRAEFHTLDMHIPAANRELHLSPPDLDALASGEVMLRRNRGRGEEFLPADAGVGVCARVANGAGPLGTLWAFDRRNRVPARDEMRVLNTVATQIGQMLGRLVLTQDNEHGQRLQRELQVVASGEESLSALPAESDLEFEVARYCSSRFEVGGDLCEVVQATPTKTVIVVGDASGDSVPAALVMNAVRGSVRTLIDVCRHKIENTERLMSYVNRALTEVTPVHQFMSLFIGVLDSESLTLTYTNAGHPCPLIHRGLGFKTLESHGVLAGVTLDATYSRSVLQLAPGDSFIAFSDGVSEAMNTEREMFRYEGVIGAIRDTDGVTAQQIMSRVLGKLELHLHGSHSGDDRSMLVIRIPEATGGA